MKSAQPNSRGSTDAPVLPLLVHCLYALAVKGRRRNPGAADQGRAPGFRFSGRLGAPAARQAQYSARAGAAGPARRTPPPSCSGRHLLGHDQVFAKALGPPAAARAEPIALLHQQCLRQILRRQDAAPDQDVAQWRALAPRLAAALLHQRHLAAAAG